MPPAPLIFPAPPGHSEPAEWTGTVFRIGPAVARVLSYSYETGNSAWTEELTNIHEDVAGDDHYIDRASRLHAASRLRRWVRRPEPVVMDLGCSSGYFLRLLRQSFPDYRLVGADYVRGPLERLATVLPEVALIQFDLSRCPLVDGSFDAIVLLNVLEHIEDDLGALRQVHRILAPGGIAVIEVPAGPHLYDIYDRQLLHFRRYRMAELLDLVRSAGFEILDRSHLGFFLYPAFRMVKKHRQKYLGASAEIQLQIVQSSIRRSNNSALMHAIMRIESVLRRAVHYPVGIRCLVTGRKREL